MKSIKENKYSKEENDAYGNGRHDVIDEIISFCYKQIDRIENAEKENSHIEAMLGGKKRAFEQVINRLESKELKMFKRELLQRPQKN